MAMGFKIEDPDEGFTRVLSTIVSDGVSEESRNGPVKRFDGPTIIHYTTPENRLILSRFRDANPFFHLMEALWMLAGRRDLEPLLRYNPQMASYSDDGKNLRGTAYGYRWFNHFGYDQIKFVIDELIKNPKNRRLAVSMWDPGMDLRKQDSLDLPCNLQVLFSTKAGTENVLDMTVTNRSNDLVYGCMGSNLFHFSFLLEYVAAATGMQIGSYYQISNNLHIYTENETTSRCVQGLETKDVVSRVDMKGARLMETLGLHTASRSAISESLSGEIVGNPYLDTVVKPLYDSYEMFVKPRLLASDKILSPEILRGVRLEYYRYARDLAGECEDPALAAACKSWLSRRISNLEVEKEK